MDVRQAKSSSEALVGAWLFTIVLVAAVSLHTRHFIGDGVRYLSQTEMAAPDHGGTSHAAFPLLLWVWARLGSFLGIPGVLSRLGVSFSRGSVAPVDECRRSSGGRSGVLRVPATLRGETARSRRGDHATNALERLSAGCNGHDRADVGCRACGCAFLVALRPEPSIRTSLTAGAILGAAGLVYQLALASGLLVAGALATEGFRRRRSYVLVGSAALASSISFAGGLWVLISLLRHEGNTAVVETAAGLFGRVRFRHLVGAVFGATNGFAPLQHWNGLGALLHSPPFDMVANLALICGLFMAVVALWAPRWRGEVRRPLLAAGALANLVAIWAVAAFWDSAYTKFWLFALPAFFLLVALTMPVARARAAKRLLPLAALMGFSLASGVVRATTDPPEMIAARELSALVKADDLLVAPGWDGASVYLRTLLRPGQRAMSLTDTSIACKLKKECVSAALSKALREADARKSKSWVLDLLDVSDADWEVFYGGRLNLPRELLAPLEARSTDPVVLDGTGSHVRSLRPVDCRAIEEFC